jgi:hypothetical protein
MDRKGELRKGERSNGLRSSPRTELKFFPVEQLRLIFLWSAASLGFPHRRDFLEVFWPPLGRLLTAERPEQLGWRLLDQIIRQSNAGAQ